MGNGSFKGLLTGIPAETSKATVAGLHKLAKTLKGASSVKREQFLAEEGLSKLVRCVQTYVAEPDVMCEVAEIVTNYVDSVNFFLNPSAFAQLQNDIDAAGLLALLVRALEAFPSSDHMLPAVLNALFICQLENDSVRLKLSAMDIVDKLCRIRSSSELVADKLAVCLLETSANTSSHSQYASDVVFDCLRWLLSVNRLACAQAAITCACNLSLSDTLRASIAALVPDLVRVIAANPLDDTIAYRGCGALSNVTVIDTARAEVVANSGIPTLVRVANLHQESLNIQQACLAALRNLAVESVERCTDVAEAGAVGVFVRFLNKFPKDPVATVAALGGLYHISNVRDLRGMLHAADAADAMVQRMLDNADDESVLQLCCGFFVGMTHSYSIEMHEKHVTALLINAARKFSDNLLIARFVTGAIWNLALNPELCEELGSLECVEVLCEFMEKYPGDEHVLQFTISGLIALMIHRPNIPRVSPATRLLLLDIAEQLDGLLKQLGMLCAVRCAAELPIDWIEKTKLVEFVDECLLDPPAAKFVLDTLEVVLAEYPEYRSRFREALEELLTKLAEPDVLEHVGAEHRDHAQQLYSSLA